MGEPRRARREEVEEKRSVPGWLNSERERGDRRDASEFGKGCSRKKSKRRSISVRKARQGEGERSASSERGTRQRRLRIELEPTHDDPGLGDAARDLEKRREHGLGSEQTFARRGSKTTRKTYALVRKNGSSIDIQLVLDRNVVSENGNVLNSGLRGRNQALKSASQRPEGEPGAGRRDSPIVRPTSSTR